MLANVWGSGWKIASTINEAVNQTLENLDKAVEENNQFVENEDGEQSHEEERRSNQDFKSFLTDDNNDDDHNLDGHYKTLLDEAQMAQVVILFFYKSYM